MRPERWQQIESVFHAALRREPGERAKYLDSACAGDEWLRKEVESLISSLHARDDLLEQPAFNLGLRLLNAEGGEPLVGSSIGPYKVLAFLGKGGMGEVYLARDSGLGRGVALKLLPAALTSDPERVKRFQREARAAASISHQNVAHIYGTGTADGRHYIAMEFVDGVTLRQRLAEKPPDTRDAINLITQIADALAAAHACGVVHRDIKPENIMLRADGLVKILDFGLAKLTEADAAGVTGYAESTTGLGIKTDPGTVMGTVRYMSPEQLRGQSADRRTDLWSLGVVLYELLTGRAPFEGLTPNDEIALILQRDFPPLCSSTGEENAALQRVLEKALSKEREGRYQRVEDFVRDLRQSLSQGEPELRPPSPAPLIRPVSAAHESAASKNSAPVAVKNSSIIFSGARYVLRGTREHKVGMVGIAAALILVAGYLVASPQLFSGQRKPPFNPQSMFITPVSNSGEAVCAAISPDGNKTAYVEERGGLQAIVLEDNETGATSSLSQPGEFSYKGLTFSRDGSRLYFVRNEGADGGALYRADLSDGATSRVIGGVDSPVSFSPDSRRIAFVRLKRAEGRYSLMIAAADGTGEQTLATKQGGAEFSVDGAAWSPDGETVACAVGWWGGGHHMSLVGYSVRTGKEFPIGKREWFSALQVAWAGGGLFVSAAEQPLSPYQLWRVPYPEGDAARITNDTADYYGVSLTPDADKVVSVQTKRISQLWVLRRDEPGRAKAVLSQVGLSYGVAWTPGGKIVLSSMLGTSLNISIMNGDGSDLRQLTAGGGNNYQPSSSADGRYIVFASDRTGTFNIWRMNADGSEPRQLTFGDGNFYPYCSPDNRWVFYDNQSEGRTTVWKVPLDGGDAIQVTDEYGRMPVVSPDGRLVAVRHYVADDRLGIALLPSAGGPPVKLLPVPIIEWQKVQWTGDGGALTYLDTAAGVSNIWRYTLANGRTKRLTNFDAERIYSYAWSQDFDQLACVRGSTISDVVTFGAPK